MARIAIIVLAVALWIYAIIDCARTSKDMMPGRLAKSVWLALTIVFPVVGSLVWLYFSFQNRHPEGLGESFIKFPGNPPKPSSGPVAPDDDPEFLAKLEAQLRFEEWERQQRGDGEDGETAQR